MRRYGRWPRLFRYRNEGRTALTRASHVTAARALVGKIVGGLVRGRQKEAPKNDEIESSHWSNFMSYLPQVIEARQISGFIVSARFDDETEERIDVSQWFKGPVFEPLKDPKRFKKFF